MRYVALRPRRNSQECGVEQRRVGASPKYSNKSEIDEIDLQLRSFFLGFRIKSENVRENQGLLSRFWPIFEPNTCLPYAGTQLFQPLFFRPPIINASKDPRKPQEYFGQSGCLIRIIAVVIR